MISPTNKKYKGGTQMTSDTNDDNFFFSDADMIKALSNGRVRCCSILDN